MINVTRDDISRSKGQMSTTPAGTREAQPHRRNVPNPAIFRLDRNIVPSKCNGTMTWTVKRPGSRGQSKSSYFEVWTP